MLHVKFEPEIRQQRAATPYWELYTKAEKNEFTLTKITSNKRERERERCLYSNFYADTTGGCSSCARTYTLIWRQIKQFQKVAIATVITNIRI